MTSELLANIERFERARDELRQAVSEAHSATKDLRLLLREIAETTEAVRTVLQETVDEKVGEFVAERLQALGPELKDQMDRSADKIRGEFDRLAKSLFVGPEGIDVREAAKMLTYNAFIAPGAVAPRVKKTKRTQG